MLYVTYDILPIDRNTIKMLRPKLLLQNVAIEEKRKKIFNSTIIKAEYFKTNIIMLLANNGFHIFDVTSQRANPFPSRVILCQCLHFKFHIYIKELKTTLKNVFLIS